jgi:hypothetical protein
LAAVEPVLGVTGSLARAIGASRAPAASIHETSSSISRKVRGGLGTLDAHRRLRAGLRCASGRVAVGFIALATVVASSTAPITASDVVVAISDARPAGGPSTARA